MQGALDDGLVRREELFLQTKFTHRAGQDHRLPYDPYAAPGVQVRQSLASSLEHLRVEELDSYVLHGPSTRHGFGGYDVEVWRAMEELAGEGKTRSLGISNVALDQLEELLGLARVRPAFVQNRCYARSGWDQAVRALCREHGIVYQGFSLLTANAGELHHPDVRRLAASTGRTIAQLVFRFAIQIGMLPLTGTTDPAHMREDLGALDFTLSEDEVALVETIGVR